MYTTSTTSRAAAAAAAAAAATKTILTIIVAMTGMMIIVMMSSTNQCYGQPVLSSPTESQNITNTTSPSGHHHRLRRQRRFLTFDLPEDRNPLPMLYIGSIDLEQYPQCEQWFEPHRAGCQRHYESFLQTQIIRRYQKYQSAIEKRMQQTTATLTANSGGSALPPPSPPVMTKPAKPFTYDRNSEYIKHASCCGMWRARKCLIEAIENDPSQALRHRLCPSDLTTRLRRLPDDPAVREDVLDYCSEYGDGSLICHYAVSFATATTTRSSFGSSFYLIIITIMILSVLFDFNHHHQW